MPRSDLNFSKNAVDFFCYFKMEFFKKKLSEKLAIFMLNFDEILSEFRDGPRSRADALRKFSKNVQEIKEA